MKRLLIALVAAVAVSTAFARLTYKQGFENGSYDPHTDFEPSVADEDDSELAFYNYDGPMCQAPYDFYGYGQRYLSLDTGDATLWRTNSGDAAYLDMVMQFNPSATAPTLDAETKIAVYVALVDEVPYLFVLSGDGNGGVATNNTGTTFTTDTWIRLTIASNNDKFDVYAVGNLVGSYDPLPNKDATIKSVGFKGTGKLDDFVARTTNPFFDNENAVVSIGGLAGERYASLEDAIADNPTAIFELEADVVKATPLAYGESIKVRLNNHTISGLTSGSLIAVETTAFSGYKTYTANYFPRTATADQDGSPDHPYEIADSDDIIALQDAILADPATFASKSYIQTADIVMDGDGQGGSLPDFYGIGWFQSSDKYASLPAGLASASTDLPFAGTYDGGGYTISKVTLVRHNYAGVFNNVSGTVKNLTVENIGFSGTCTEWGCAIVGNAQGSALLENLTSQTWGEEGPWGDNANHNVAGIVVRAQNAVTIRGCVNNAPITSISRRLGGIIAFTGNTAPTGTITIESCTNNADLTVNTGSNAGDRGIGGIISRPESVADGLVIRNCANFGVLTNNGVPAKVGAIAGELNSQNYVDDGGNTYLATLGPVGNYNGKTVTGLIYALPVTIDNNDYLTTVKESDLAAGNTYTLLRGVDSPAAVYTFDAPGWIAFKGSSEFGFYGIVDADTTTLVLTEDYSAATSTKTFTAVAGAASVDDRAYETFADALTAIDNGWTTQDYVTLLTNVTYTFSVGDTLRVKVGTHTFTPVYAADVALVTYIDAQDVSTFTAAQGIAKCNGTLYASLQDAIDDSTSGATIELIADSSEAVMVGAGKSFTFVESENATFTGTFDGSGTVAMTAAPKKYVYTGAANGGTLFANGWTGTFQIAWNPGSVCFVFDDFGNANSVVKISGANDGANDTFGAFPSTFWVGSTLGAPSIAPAIELACTWTIANGWTGTTTAFSKLSGTGDLTIQNTTYARSYSISTLDGYSGTISTGKHEVRYGNIVKAGADFDVCLVKAGTTFTCDLTSSQVNGTAATLVVATVNDQKGIYLARAAVNGTGYLTVADAIAEAEAKCANTVVVLDESTAEIQGWTLDNGVYTYASSRAYIDATGYPTLAAAVAAAGENEVTIDLVDHIWEDVTVPANVTVAVADDVQIRGGTLSGAGRFVYTKVPNQFRFTFNNWTGTVTLNYADVVSGGDLANQIVAYGNGNSVVEIGPDGTVSGTSYINSDLVTTLKVSGYVSIDNGSSYTKRTFPRITGDGVLVFGSSGGRVNYAVNELVDWNGVLTNSSASAFVTNLVSGAGTVVFNAAAPAVTVGESFDGSVVYNTTPSGAPVVDADSECEVYLNFNYAGMNIAPYGNEKSTIKLGDLSADNAYLNDGDGSGTGQIPSKVIVAGDVTMNNGWTQYPDYSWTGSKTLQFNEFKVDGSFALLSTRTWNDAHCYYYIKSLNGDGAGSITVGAGYSLRIDAVDFAEAPSGDDCIVPLTVGAGTASATAGELCGADGVRNGPIPVTVNGEATEQSLVYDAEKGGLVLYVAPTAKATYDGTDYPTVEQALTVAFIARPNSFGKVITVLDENWEDEGAYDEFFTWDPVARTYTVITYPARILMTYYPSLAAAVTAATDGDTIVLTADASMPSVEFGEKYGVNCAQGDSEIVINKAITLDGNGHTIYGLSNYFTHEMADGCHDIFISGSKNVTIKNVTLSDFGGSAYVSKFTYPIWTSQGYTGTLVLDNVTVRDYNRTAFNFNGGTVVVTNCTVVGDAPTPRNTNGAYFQNGIGVLNANVTVFDSTFSGIGAYDPDNADSNAAECFQLMGNGATSGTGSITVNGGSYSGQYVAIVADNATGTIALNGGDFVGTLDVEEGSTGSIAVSGGTFDRQVPAAYCASGKVPTTTPDAQGKYTVVDYVPPSDIDPTSGTEIVVDPTKTPEQQAADAQAAAAAMDVKKTAEAEAASVDQTTWNSYFTKTAEKVNDTWVAKAELNPAVVLPVDGAEETPLTEMLESVAAMAIDTTKETSASVPTKAGLYYWIEGATEVGAASYTPGNAELGDGTTKELGRPTLTGENGKAFFKVCVGVAAPVKD